MARSAVPRRDLFHSALPVTDARGWPRRTSGVRRRTLLTLGIILGIIAFAVGTAIACLRATERARKAEAAAQIEADRYRMSESTLETLLTAEPQALMVVAESGEAELLVASLPAGSGCRATRPRC